MSASSVNEQQIVEALRSLPRERWGEILDFIASMGRAEEERSSTPAPVSTARDLAQSQLVGIWADRSDIGETQTFARQLRERAEHRGGGGNATRPY